MNGLPPNSTRRQAVLTKEHSMQHATIYRTPRGDGYVQLLAVDGESYPVTPDTRLFIDGQEYMAIRSQIKITVGKPGPDSVATGTVVTTITLVPNDWT